MNLQKKVDDILAALSKAKAKLEALDKVELVHGDELRYDHESYVVFRNDKTFDVYDLNGYRNGSGVTNDTYQSACYRRTGYNFFADLKRNHKDLREFEVDGLNYRDKINAHITHLNRLWIATNSGGTTLDIDSLTELIQSLSATRATMRRDEEKK